LQGDVFRLLKLYASAETSLTRCADIQSEDGDIGSPAFGEAAVSSSIIRVTLIRLQSCASLFSGTADGVVES